MKIEYTYQEPKDNPIKTATFLSSAASNCTIKINEVDAVVFYFGSCDRIFNRADFAELTALINRINRQIGNE